MVELFAVQVFNLLKLLLLLFLFFFVQNIRVLLFRLQYQMYFSLIAWRRTIGSCLDQHFDRNNSVHQRQSASVLNKIPKMAITLETQN